MGFIDYNKDTSTIKKTSWDDNAGKALIYDKDPRHPVLNFDKIEKKMSAVFHRNLRRSCDAYVEKNGMRYLIEFKNQSDGNIDGTEIRDKIYDSIALLSLNESIPRKALAERTVAIVVYNNNKHIPDKSSAAPSPAIDKFTRTLKTYANKKDLDSYPKKFLVNCFIGKLIHNAYTVDVEVFQNEIMPMVFGK